MCADKGPAIHIPAGRGPSDRLIPAQPFERLSLKGQAGARCASIAIEGFHPRGSRSQRRRSPARQRLQRAERRNGFGNLPAAAFSARADFFSPLYCSTR